MADDAVQMTPGLPAGFGPELVIRFFPEYARPHPLWFDIGDPDLADLQLPDELAERLRRWSHYWDSTYHWDDGWPTGTPAPWWSAEEIRLPRDLALTVGSNFIVHADDRYLRSTTAPRSPTAAAALYALVQADAEERARIRADIAGGARFTMTAGDQDYSSWLAARRQNDPSDR